MEKALDEDIKKLEKEMKGEETMKDKVQLNIAK